MQNKNEQIGRTIVTIYSKYFYYRSFSFMFFYNKGQKNQQNRLVSAQSDLLHPAISVSDVQSRSDWLNRSYELTKQETLQHMLNRPINILSVGLST